MRCNKCGFGNAENLKYCGNCGNKIVIPEPLIIPKPDQMSKSKLDPKRDPFAKNYKKIFNICLYSVIGCIALFILISSFKGLANLFGTIMDIFLNVWIWLFIIFIFIFRVKHKVWSLIISIIFGLFTILAAISSLINPAWAQVLK